MDTKEVAVKPWKRSESGSFGDSVMLWALVLFVVPIASFPAVLLANWMYEAGYMPEILVDPLSWFFSYVPTVVMVVGMLSLGLAILREIRYWHQEHGAGKTNNHDS